MKLIKGIELADKTLEKLDDGFLRIVEDGTEYKRFEPVYNKDYFFVDCNGFVAISIWEGNLLDNYRLKNLKLFNTEEECKRYLKYVKRKNDLSKNFEIGIENWYLYFNPATKSIETDFDCYCIQQGATYFNSRGTSKQLINEFGENSMLAWEFGIYNYL